MERAISGLLPYKRRALGGRQEHAFLQTKRQNEDDFIWKFEYFNLYIFENV